MKATIEQTPTELRILTPYSSAFIADLKAAIPYADRSWVKPAWIVSVIHLPAVLSLCQTHFGGAQVKLVDAGVKSSLGLNAAAGQVVLVEYVGACKQRDDGSSSAYGWWNGGWNVIFPEEVLRGYFKQSGARNKEPKGGSLQPQSFYQVLAVEKAAEAEEIKRAFKRLARIWHPDVNHEEDAQERFIALKRAYNVLGDPQSRRRYDAGLQLEASLSKPVIREREWEAREVFYRAPLTCGKVEVKGQTRLGRIHVEAIEAWFDVVNLAGKTMVSSWNRDAKEFQVEWVADFQVEV